MTLPTEVPAVVFVVLPLMLVMYAVIAVAMVRAWQAERFHWRQTTEAHDVMTEVRGK